MRFVATRTPARGQMHDFHLHFTLYLQHTKILLKMHMLIIQHSTLNTTEIMTDEHTLTQTKKATKFIYSSFL